MTTYAILRLVDGEEEDQPLWSEYKYAEASSPDRAIKACDPTAGVYVAIPQRSWKPLTVKTETQTRITVTDA